MQHITLEELKQWRAEGKDFQLIDVREPMEHEACNIGGKLIPLGKILKEKDQLDTSKPIVVYCKRGIRSQIAIQRLSMELEADFYNLTGGIYDLIYS